MTGLSVEAQCGMDAIALISIPFIVLGRLFGLFSLLTCTQYLRSLFILIVLCALDFFLLFTMKTRSTIVKKEGTA